MELPISGESISIVKNENEITSIERNKEDSSKQKPTRKWRDKFGKGAKKRVQKLKMGIQSGVQKLVLRKILKMGIDKLQKDFWIGVEIFKEGAQIGMKKLKRASTVSSQMAHNSIKNTKVKVRKLRLKANEKAKAMKIKLVAIKNKSNLKKLKAKKDLKKLNAKIKVQVKKVGRNIKKFGVKLKLKYAKTKKGLKVLNNKFKIKRVNLCVWFMYNCYTMKLMCLQCWMIENPQVIMKNIKKCESSCAMLIPNGYGVIIHKSLILTPYQYINDSKKALQGAVLIQFGSQKPHSPIASCVASNVEIERGLVCTTLKQQPYHLNLQSNGTCNVQSLNASKVEMSTNESKLEPKTRSLASSQQGSPTTSKQGTRLGSPTSSNHSSRMGSRSLSKTTSRAGTPPSTPKKQHTHKLLPSRIFICNEALDLTLLACDPLPKSMVPLGLGKAYNGRNMDLYRRVYLLGYKKELDGTTSSLSIGMGRIIDMDNLLIKFATLIDNWYPGSIGFDERGNFSFIVCNPQKLKLFVSENTNVDNLPSLGETSFSNNQLENSKIVENLSNSKNIQMNDKLQSINIPINSSLVDNGYLLSHRSAFGIRRYEIEDYEFGPKFELKETVEHTGVVVQGIRQWIIQHWEGLSFDKLIPPLGWRYPSIKPIPLEYDSHTNPKNVKQKWCNDYNRPPTYLEMALFMNVYNRLAALRRECSRAEREHNHFKNQCLSSITKQQCLDKEAHGENLINPGCSKFRRSHVVKKEPPRNFIRKTSATIHRTLAHKLKHHDSSKPTFNRKSKKTCQGCI